MMKLFSIFTWLFNSLLFAIKDVNYTDRPRVNGYLMIKGRGKITIGKNVSINSSFNSNPVGLGTQTALYTANKDASITIGNNVGISNSLLFSFNDIIVEDDVLIGGGSQILDSDFHSIDYKQRVAEKDSGIQSKPIHIKKGAFIGTNSIILKGVTIGAYSVIAAGSVVAKSVPDKEIWGGNPAKFLKSMDS